MGGGFEEIRFQLWETNISWQMNSFFYCMQKTLEIMKKQGFGSLIKISSIYGAVGPDFDVYNDTNMTMPAAYSAIKGGINSLTKYLASYYGKKTPLGRMAIPKDISPSVVFLLSEESTYIT